jgi:hypothetical protein
MRVASSRRARAKASHLPAPIRLAGSVLGKNPHVCAFFDSAEEEYRVLLPFIREGFDRGERALHVVDPELRQDHLSRLRDGGFETDAAEHSRQLDVLTWANAHLDGGQFRQQAMLNLLDAVLAEGVALGYPLTRLVSHMEWALSEAPGVDDLIEYESRFNDVSIRHADPVICVYDTRRFGAEIAMDVLRTHPMVILGGMLQENPFFVPPEVFLRQLRERQTPSAAVPAQH